MFLTIVAAFLLSSSSAFVTGPLKGASSLQRAGFHGGARVAGRSFALSSTKDKEEKEEKEESSGGGHQVKGFPEPSEEDKLFMETLKKHQDGAAKLTFAEEVRSLLAYSSGFGVISTNSGSDEGYPAGSVVGFAVEDDGNFIFCFSGMSGHTQDLLKDGRASLTVTASDFKGAADGRVSVVGDVVKVPEEERAQCADTYLKKHEGAYWVQFGDFTWFRLQDVRAVRFVGGFARAGNITPKEYADAQPDPITAFAAPVMGHMNDDHSDATLVMIKHYVGIEVESAELVGMDRLGFTVKCSRQGQFFKLRLPFIREATDRADVKKIIVEMTQAAAGSA